MHDEVKDINEFGPEMTTKINALTDYMKEYKDTEAGPIEIGNHDVDDIVQDYEISEVPSDEIASENSVSAASSNVNGQDNNHNTSEGLSLSSSSVVSNPINSRDNDNLLILSVPSHYSMLILNNTSNSSNQHNDKIIDLFDKTHADNKALDQVETDMGVKEVEAEEVILKEPTIMDQNITTTTAKDKIKPMDEELDDQYKDYMNTLNVLRNATNLYYQEASTTL